MIRVYRKYQSICLFLLGDVRAETSSSVISLSLLDIFHVQSPIVSPHRQAHEYLERALWGYFEVNFQYL